MLNKFQENVAGYSAATATLIAVPLAFFGDVLTSNVSDLIAFLKEWQDFSGALIAALVALFVVVLTEQYRVKNEHDNHLHLLHRCIGAALANLADIDHTINNFSEDQLMQMITGVQNSINNNQPSMCYGFVPLLHVFEIGEGLLTRFSGSGYIDILTIQLINKSKDLRKIIDDINRQFETSITMNNQVIVNKLNPNPNPQNISFKRNLEEFKKKMIETDFRTNVRIYATLLIKAQIATAKLQEWGVATWKNNFKHVVGRNIEEQIDSYFDKEIKSRKIMYQDSFVTNLS